MIDLFGAAAAGRAIWIGIVGSRRRNTPEDYAAVLRAFNHLKLEYDCAIEIKLVSGGCPQGGDRFAELIAAEQGLEIVIHRPDEKKFLSVAQPWRSIKQLYERNTLIARDAKSHLIACVSSDRTGGTEDTIRKYRSLHKREPILC